jgi:hypothetical protein
MHVFTRFMQLIRRLTELVLDEDKDASHNQSNYHPVFPFVEVSWEKSVKKNTFQPAQNGRDAADHVYRVWDEALGIKDVDAALALYAPDATIESALVSYLLGSESGIVRGHDSLRPFITLVFQRTPKTRKRYRNRYFTDDQLLM